MRKSVFVKAIALFLCICFCICPLCACKTADGGKTVYWLLSSSPKNLDPQTAKSESELQIIKNCFSGLFEKDQNGELVSSVVDSYVVTSDGLKYTFKLNPDAYWCIIEGREIKKYAPITAQDFAFAIKRVFKDNPTADVMNTLRSIKNADAVLSGGNVDKLGIKCEGDSTLIISLSKKNSALLEAFTNPVLFPCQEEFFNSTSGRYGLSEDTLIFNGSFCLSSWGESSVKIVENDKFSGKKPQVSAVLFYQPKSTREHVALLSEGEIDAALLSSSQFDAIENPDAFSVNRYTAKVWALVLNPSHELWQNENLRKAVSACTDRGVLTDGEHHTMSEYLIPDGAEVFSKDYRALAGYPTTRKYDAESAKALYTSALSELELAQIYNCEILIADNELCKNNFAALNQVYQRELSLYFSPSYLSEAALLSKVKNGDFAAALVPLNVSYNNPDCILSYFSESSPDCIFPIKNAKFDSNISAAIGASSAADAAANYKSAEQALYDSFAVNALFAENGYFVSSKATSGFYLDASGEVIFSSVKKK